MEPALPPGTIAGEPEVVDPEPDATGRSDDGVESGEVDCGATVDCANTGVARAVAKSKAAICFVSMVNS